MRLKRNISKKCMKGQDGNMSELAHRQAMFTIEQLKSRKKRKEIGQFQADKFRREIIIACADRSKRR